MAPLYKRYIPPKSSVTTVASSTKLSSKPKVTQISEHQDEPKKRKRERTEEEIAERKAKKLRKKGIDPATAVVQSLLQPSKDGSGTAQSFGSEKVHANEDREESANGARGEFAHIRSAKQRHKLEKEARSVRKAAEKESKRDGKSGDGNQDQPSDPDQGGDEAANMENGVALGPSQPDFGGDSGNTKRKKRRKGERVVGAANEPSEAAEDSHDTIKKPRTKKNKELGTDRSKDDDVSLEGGPEKMPQAGNEEREHDTKPPQPKKRRHKLESVLQQPADEDVQSALNGDDHLKKHGPILDNFLKSTRLARKAPQPETAEEKHEVNEPVLRDLIPLPQPEKASSPEFKHDSSSLPSWLAKPTIVFSERKQSFEQLNLDSKTVQQISKLGFSDALPVQQALIPLLLPPGLPGSRFLPNTESVLPDIAVSAPTGSGKTMAYLLPIIESLKRASSLGRIKALVVVPTRELVVQVAAVAESVAKGSSIKVGMATGTGNFKDEQTKLVEIERKYDPAGYRKLMAKAHRRNYSPAQDAEDFEQYLDELADQDVKEDQRVRDAVSVLVDHVPVYYSAVDILVATPGRLLEHLSSTLGLSLAYLEWLILDEADKLLDQQYDGFISTINDEIFCPRHEEQQDARERYLRSSGLWDEQREQRVRKVVLSATMTRDISKLMKLKLEGPRMIVVRGGEQDVMSADGGAASRNVDGGRDAADDFELAPTLREYSVPVGDGSEKPLYLIELLGSRIMSTSFRPPTDEKELPRENGRNDPDIDSSTDSDSGANSDSSSVSESNDTSSQNSRDGGDDEGSTRGEPQELSGLDVSMHPERAAMLDRISQREVLSITIPTVLIFTSSTESANRLSHLLKTLRSDWASYIITLTKTAQNYRRPSNSKPTNPVITISTDRAARGLDAVANRSITHVIQYDVPRSATSYVHRVGRTARVGKRGEAWTLFTHSEARWFIKEVANVKKIKRADAVEKVRLSVDDEEMLQNFQDAVSGMREEVMGHGDKSK